MWATQPNWSDARVAAISVPVVVDAGEYDEAILRARPDRMAGLSPGARLVILPQANHFAMLEASEEYSAAVGACIG